MKVAPLQSLPITSESLSPINKEISQNGNQTKNRLDVCLKKVCHAALFIFKSSLSLALYWINPSLFAVGFFVGIAFDQEVSKAIEKIKNIWKTQPWNLCLIAAVAGFCSLPVTLAVGSLLWSSSLGSTMSKKAQNLMTIPECSIADGISETPLANESG